MFAYRSVIVRFYGSGQWESKSSSSKSGGLKLDPLAHLGRNGNVEAGVGLSFRFFNSLQYMYLKIFLVWLFLSKWARVAAMITVRQQELLT